MYVAAIGAVVGALAVGLVMPFVVTAGGAGRSQLSGIAGQEVLPAERASSQAADAAQTTEPVETEDTAGAAVGPDQTPPASTPGTNAPSTPSSAGGQAASTGTLKVGILLLDLGGASSLGFDAAGIPSTERQRRIWQTWVDNRNQTGGVGGRVIEPVYRAFDAVDQGDQRAACIELTEDAGVFAVLESTSGYARDAISCVTQEHSTPMLTAATPVQVSHDIARRAGSFFFGLSMSATRTLSNAAVEWDRLGLLKGKRIGILDLDGFTSTIDVGLVPKLREMGHEVARRVVFAADQQTAATQVPTSVIQMRNARVDTIIMATDGLTGTQFVQEADAQQYRPRYLASDYIQYTQDFNTQNMSDGFDGAVAVTAQRTVDLDNLPLNAAERRCQELYERASGTKLVRDQDGDYPFVMLSCAVLGYLADGAGKVAGELTRGSLSTAIQNLGAIEPPYMAPGTFRPGKFDAADQLATMRWQRDCSCWRRQGGYRPAAIT